MQAEGMWTIFNSYFLSNLLALHPLLLPSCKLEMNQLIYADGDLSKKKPGLLDHFMEQRYKAPFGD